MQNGGQSLVVEQLQVVSVEVVPDEHLAAAVGGVERLEDGLVAAADGVDGVDAGVSLQRPQGRLPDGGVEPVGVGLFDRTRPVERLLMVARNPISRSSSPRNTLRLSAISTSPLAVAEEPVDQVRRGGAGGSVVDADVGDALAQRDVGDQGDDGDPGLVELRDGVG